jgi:histidinol phosphatase-like enzyme
MSKADTFLDRDGVIVRCRSDYVKSWEEYMLAPDLRAATDLILATTEPG